MREAAGSPHVVFLFMWQMLGLAALGCTAILVLKGPRPAEITAALCLAISHPFFAAYTGTAMLGGSRKKAHHLPYLLGMTLLTPVLIFFWPVAGLAISAAALLGTGWQTVRFLKKHAGA